MAVLVISAGRKDGVKPGNIVGAIANEANIDGRQIGGIRVEGSHTLVQVPEALADEIIDALRGTTLMGKRVNAKRAQED